MAGPSSADLATVTGQPTSERMGRFATVSSVSVVQTLLVYVGIPAAIVAVLALGVYGRSLTHQPNRYRPGRAWEFEPVWYVPHPENLPASHNGHHAALPAAQRRAVEAAPARRGDQRDDQPAPTPAAVGGASGEW